MAGGGEVENVGAVIRKALQRYTQVGWHPLMRAEGVLDGEPLTRVIGFMSPRGPLYVFDI